MLATILRSPQATAATIAIIDVFTKLRELSHTITKLVDAKEKPEQQSLIDERSECRGRACTDMTERVRTSKGFSPSCKEAGRFFLN